MPHNPNCDGAHCDRSNGEVRRLPTSGDAAIIVCRGCYNHEMGYRVERNKELEPQNRYPLPLWESLEVYP